MSYLRSNGTRFKGINDQRIYDTIQTPRIGQILLNHSARDSPKRLLSTLLQSQLENSAVNDVLDAS